MSGSVEVNRTHFSLVLILSIDYGSAVVTAVKVAFNFFLFGGVYFVVAVLVGALHAFHFLFG